MKRKRVLMIVLMAIFAVIVGIGIINCEKPIPLVKCPVCGQYYLQGTHYHESMVIDSTVTVIEDKIEFKNK